MEDLLKVGVITTTHGVRGEVKVYPTTDEPERFLDLEYVLLDTGKELRRLDIKNVRFFKNLVILKFDGIDNINDIEKCLINLIGNAMKFTPEGGKIIIRISDLNDKVKISIIDSGIGISEKDINEIFNRFEQAYNKKSEEFGGSGIGLMLTKQIIELHKGDLVVKSELGKGSEFSILLPVKQLK